MTRLASAPVAALVERVRRMEPGAVARALSLVTEEREGAEELLRGLFAAPGRSHKIGFCGSPGSGKSSLINRLVAHYRSKKETVGVLAVDPTSHITGGAFLGDRLRIQEHALDAGVFMRSLATRGMLGGLSGTIFGAIHVLEAAGFQHILLETVGTGQDEVDVAEVADTVVCVSAPYQGDEFQAMKAGMMEIADIFAVNKSDLPEADRALKALRDALGLKPEEGPGWAPRVHAVSAMANTGVAELGALLKEHRDFLGATGEGARRLKRQLKRELQLWMTRRLARDVLGRIKEEHVERLARKEADPVTLGRRLLGKAHAD